MEDYYYRQVIEKSSFGYANHRIVLDEENNPIDYIFLEVNEAFEKLYKEGKVRNFGVSNHNSMQIELLNKYLTNNIIREVSYEKN